ncbi:MAG: DUF998 domain-containing protein [Thermoproteota archaeon]
MKLFKVLGILGAVIAYPFIVVSIMLSPWFNFFNNALSDLGNVSLNGFVAMIYNSGMILSGLIVTIFGISMSFKHVSWKYLIWVLPLLVAGINLMLIGIFPEDAGSIHSQVSEIFFASIAVVSLTYSYASWKLGTPEIGAISLIFGIVSPLIWFVEWPWHGVAIQETITSALSAILLVMVSLRNV